MIAGQAHPQFCRNVLRTLVACLYGGLHGGLAHLDLVLLQDDGLVGDLYPCVDLHLIQD